MVLNLFDSWARGDEAIRQIIPHTRAAWTITLNQPVERATIHFSDGDTLALRLSETDAYQAARTLRYSGFYYLEFIAPAQRRYRSDYYALSIIEDLPPVLTVVQPDLRTVIEPGEPAEAAVKVLADDDYGLREIRLVATVAKGTGENVKFREQALDFDTSTQSSSPSWTLETTLDLAAMGMETGDELKAALAEMWEVELYLRTYRPEDALPYEYRALRILKALQQKSRIYVKRIGFEPPPLKPDEARLTGDLDEVPSRKTRQDLSAEASFPAIREALAVLQSLHQTPDEEEAVAVLERAGQELAGVAVEEAGRYLTALQDLRALIDDLDAGRGWRRANVGSVRRAFWNVLPPADALPAPRREGATSLSHRYFKKLGQSTTHD